MKETIKNISNMYKIFQIYYNIINKFVEEYVMKISKIARTIVALFLALIGLALLAPLCSQYPSFVILLLLIVLNVVLQIGGK